MTYSGVKVPQSQRSGVVALGQLILSENMAFKEEEIKREAVQEPPPNDDVNFPPLHAGRQDFRKEVNKETTDRLAAFVVSVESGERLKAKMKEDEEN